MCLHKSFHKVIRSASTVLVGAASLPLMAWDRLGQLFPLVMESLQQAKLETLDADTYGREVRGQYSNAAALNKHVQQFQRGLVDYEAGKYESALNQWRGLPSNNSAVVLNNLACVKAKLAEQTRNPGYLGRARAHIQSAMDILKERQDNRGDFLIINHTVAQNYKLLYPDDAAKG